MHPAEPMGGGQRACCVGGRRLTTDRRARSAVGRCAARDREPQSAGCAVGRWCRCAIQRCALAGRIILRWDPNVSAPPQGTGSAEQMARRDKVCAAGRGQRGGRGGWVPAAGSEELGTRDLACRAGHHLRPPTSQLVLVPTPATPPSHSSSAQSCRRSCN